MQRIIPIAFRDLIPESIWKVLTELSFFFFFFKNITSKKLLVSKVRAMEKSIPIILCSLESIFPPSLFDPIEHLSIRLPYEAKMGGP